MPPQPAERTRPRTGVSPGLRHPAPADGSALWALAGLCGLDQNSPYAYILWGEYFADTSVVAVQPRTGDDDADEVIGFVSGFRLPRDPDTVFVWQVAVSPDHRQRGVAGRMLDHLVESTKARCIEATVTPSNGASAALFRALAERHGTRVDECVLFGADLFPDGHEAEVRFRIPVGTSPLP